MQFSWIDIILVFGYKPNSLFWAQNWPKIAFSSNNSSETHRNYWKPYLNRFLRSIMTHWCSFHELILNWCSATTQKSLFWGPKWAQNTVSSNNSSETHRNYWKPYINRFLRSIMTHWCSFHELILNWYSATTQKSLFWCQNGPKISFSSNNSSETHRNYWKPYINRFLRIDYDILVQFSWIDIKLVFSYNPKIPILGPEMGQKYHFPVITAQKHTETIENRI